MMTFTPLSPIYPTQFDKRDSTKSPCFYAESGIKWFQRNAPQRLTDAGESATMKIQKGILPIDGQFRKLVTKTVTVFLDQRAVTFLCDLCKQSGLIRWFQESSEQPSAVHSHSSSIPPFPVLPVVRGAVSSAFASENWPPTRYGSTPCEYIIRKSRTLQAVFRLFYFSACQPAKTEVSYDTTEGLD